jgi:hypothetical protein
MTKKASDRQLLKRSRRLRRTRQKNSKTQQNRGEQLDGTF